ncbi:MAG: SDR family oxidoreductase [Ferruginibacter sp.]
MKKIIVFGATGGTGKEVVKQALEKGYEVTAIVRKPAAFDLQHPHLKIIKGDVLEPATFEKEIQGNGAVLSCLGTTSTKFTTLYSEGIVNIISAMNKAGVKRLLCITALPLYLNDEMGFFLKAITKITLEPILKNPYNDMRLMETKVESSNLYWTIVRPPGLNKKPLTGKYRTAISSHISHPWSIARADLAHYMLSIIDNAETFKSKTEISY